MALRGSLRGDHHQRLPPVHKLRMQRAEEGTQANGAIISGNHLRTSSACSEPRYVTKPSLSILSNLHAEIVSTVADRRSSVRSPRSPARSHARSHSDRNLADASPLVRQGKLAKYGPLAHDPNERRIGRVAVGGGLCGGLDGLSGGGLGDVTDGHDALPRLQDVPEEVRNQRPSAAISSHQEAIRSHQEAIKTFIASASLSAAIRRPPGGHQEPSGAIKHPPRHR